jgi:hypothetical protein
VLCENSDEIIGAIGFKSALEIHGRIQVFLSSIPTRMLV